MKKGLTDRPDSLTDGPGCEDMPVLRETTVRGQRKTTLKQRNHDEFCIPPGMEAFADEPLYMLIARWCLAQGGWTDRNRIAGAFGITERRASYQISYITRKKALIHSRVRASEADSGHNRRYELRVERVINRAEKPEGASRRTAAEGMPGARRTRVGNGDRALWRWVLYGTGRAEGGGDGEQ
ncbi:TPA: CaiF/GrlA family transcriptional regulator [Salmonella enterica subsp. salamae serovar 28:r:e,n,z15]|nr:CaiF/GrlA family transcriptional regulator [Salmonella enterica subsp. salamae serovar 28:r:e,n,z15]